ncbi:OVARIAN TUMOR DOMAIN-containing deubiquitinating enzyme 7-like isoform X2 [Rutidosis leptorrhynchoides]
MVVDYITDNRENFEPFIEDEVPFDEYCLSMGKDGTWAGHMELQATSLVTHTNICIHRKSSPRWYIKNFSDHDVKMIHLSYHDFEHYNSVRLKDDTCNGPAMPIIIKADADLSVKPQQVNSSVSKNERRFAKTVIPPESLKIVKVGSGCENEDKIQQVLLQVDGDVDAAIEFIIADKTTEECSVEYDRAIFSMDTSNGSSSSNDLSQREKCEEKIENISAKEKPTCRNTKRENDNSNSVHDEKKIARNKACPCGSKKKYKSCCGTAVRRSSTVAVAVAVSVDNGKGRKDKKRGTKGGSANSSVLHGSDDGSLDMGALCI